MKFTTKTEKSVSNFKINHSDKLVLIGSCFSDEMAVHLTDAGFYVNANPFGTLFHPLAIASAIRSAIREEKSIDVLKREDVYLSWGTAAKINAFSEESLTAEIVAIRKQLRRELSGECVLVVTFGTAWGYVHQELNKIVGNCHKAPSSTFEKILSNSEEIVEEWKSLLDELSQLNPSLKVIFTVSPVRHIKDGLIGNNRSKSRLIEAVHELVQDTNSYFPAFEILTDELRDYRFYGEDLVHPTAISVVYIFEQFEEMYFDEKTRKLSSEVLKIKKLLAHKSLFPNSLEDQARISKANEKKAALSNRHPEIHW